MQVSPIGPMMSIRAPAAPMPLAPVEQDDPMDVELQLDVAPTQVTAVDTGIEPVVGGDALDLGADRRTNRADAVPASVPGSITGAPRPGVDVSVVRNAAIATSFDPRPATTDPAAAFAQAVAGLRTPSGESSNGTVGPTQATGALAINRAIAAYAAFR